jgi:uncharacterized iron-regulated membrane protein
MQVPGGGSGAFQIRMAVPGDPRRRYSEGSMVVFVDQYSGEVLETRRAEDRPVASRLLYEWLLPIHTGEIAGLGGRIAIAVGGIAPAFLVGTGLYTWSRRRRVRGRRAARRACAGRAAT